jgi:RimJ/RimL family protein N-acetyltransferase
VDLQPEYPIRTARLRLRPVTLADTDAMLTYRGRADVCRFLPFDTMTHETLAQRIEDVYSGHVSPVEGQGITLAAERVADNRIIGDVVLFYRSAEHAGGELGYVFHPDVAGRGYGFEASAAMLALGFEGIGFHRIIARIDARNHPSSALAQRLGMRLEAHFRENEQYEGEWADELVYAMLTTEWPGSPAGLNWAAGPR